MRSRGGGCVVNLTDAALTAPRGRFAPYLASKAALEALTKSLARELAPEVRVNAVAPGAILPPAGAGPEEAERLARLVPAGRTGTVEELAAAVVFCVRGPGFVTGARIAVDGAQHT
jgi:pteridine reductase